MVLPLPQDGPPETYWLAALFEPGDFLIAILYIHSLAAGVPFHELTLVRAKVKFNTSVRNCACLNTVGVQVRRRRRRRRRRSQGHPGTGPLLSRCLLGQGKEQGGYPVTFLSLLIFFTIPPSEFLQDCRAWPGRDLLQDALSTPGACARRGRGGGRRG